MKSNRQKTKNRKGINSREIAQQIDSALHPSLPQTQQANVRFAFASLILVGLMLVVPTLFYRHKLPLTTYDQEWWSVLLGMLAAVFLLARSSWQQPEIPRIVQLPVALIVIAWLQWSLGKIAYIDQALLYSLYFLFAALLMVLGARLRDCLGMAKLAQVLSVFLLIGAELNALIGVQQHYHLFPVLDAVVVSKISAGIFGNLAQPNHYANFIALGLVSLGLLYHQHRLKAVYVIALAAPLLLVMTLSGSRSSWLYLLTLNVLAWWWARRDTALRPLLRYSLMLLAGFALMHLAVQLSLMVGTAGGAGNAGSSGSATTVQRMFDDETGSGNIRLYLWREAALMCARSPWLGVGFGQFAWHHFQLAPVLQPAGNIIGYYNNAHNLVFQLAAETGFAGLLALAGAIGAWLYGLRRATLDAAHWWCFAALSIQAIHSMLEYPLWYTYFVSIAAILLGALDYTRYSLKSHIAARLSIASILLVGAIALAQLYFAHQHLQKAAEIFYLTPDKNTAVERIREQLFAVIGGKLLSPYAEISLSGQIEPDGVQLEEKLALNSRVIRFMPIGQVAYRQAILLAQAGQVEQAKAMMEQAIWSYHNGFKDALQQLAWLAQKDSEHFSALLEFALQKEQEYRSAVRHK